MNKYLKILHDDLKRVFNFFKFPTIDLSEFDSDKKNGFKYRSDAGIWMTKNRYASWKRANKPK